MKLGLLLCALAACSSGGGTPDGGGDASPTKDATPDAVFDGADETTDAAASIEMLYVATNDGAAISTWPVTAAGNASPSSVLAGPSTRLAKGTTLDIAVDDGGKLYVMQSDAVLVFDPGASGDVAPARSFTRNDVGRFVGIAVAPGGTPFVLHVSKTAVSEVGVYSSAASGAVDPLRAIGGPSTEIDVPMAIALSGTSIFVTASTLVELASSANGDVPPLSSRAFTNGDVAYVAADASKNAFVTQPLFFAEHPEGQPSAKHVVGGATTGITGASGIAVDASGDVFVANVGSTSSILVFAAGSDGDVAPSRTLSGSLTAISASTGNPMPIAIR